jgi:peptidoglycan/xylan/chitin deacetylase (PgdA/CDA1 family)
MTDPFRAERYSDPGFLEGARPATCGCGMIASMPAGEQLRSAELLLWPDGHAATAEGREAAAAAFPGRRPGPPRRFLQALAAKRGKLGQASEVTAALAGARRAALGAAAEGPPRVLVRVDEFPHARAFDPAGKFGSDAFRRFHAVMAEAGVHYLLAATPRVSRDYLDPGAGESRALDPSEVEVLRALREEGMVFALHGLDHRTRHRSPRRRSEFLGLDRAAAAERVDRARALLGEAGVPTPVFVAPFNRFAPAHYDLLAERFEVVCGGPESIRLMGCWPTPAWCGEAVYLPSYAPLYARSQQILEELRALERAAAGTWAPVTLHWGWELEDDFAGLRELCREMARLAFPWDGFLEAVRASAGPA